MIPGTGTQWLEMRKKADNWRQVTWLASYPKSGNTWVRALLDAYYHDGKPQINRMSGTTADTLALWIGSDAWFDVCGAPVEVRCLSRGYGLSRLVDLAMRRERKWPLVLKTHSFLGSMRGAENLPRMLTKGVVYLVRDPRTVLPSWAAHLENSLDKTVEAMCQMEMMLDEPDERRLPDIPSSWSVNVRSYLNAPEDLGVFVVRYEDLKKDPVLWFAAILEYIGFQPDMDLVKRSVDACEMQKLQAQEAKIGFLEAKGGGKFFGGEREKPNEMQIARLVKGCEPEMRRLGYLKAESENGRCEKQLLRVQSA